MSRPEEVLIGILRTSGVDFAASLPCEKIKGLLEMVGTSFFHVPLTREEEGVGIAAGAALAGKSPALFVQSSGVGNMINALLSLTAFYALPLAVFVSRRGVYRETIAAQAPVGKRLPKILAGAGIAFTEVNSEKDLVQVRKKLPGVYGKSRIHAFLLSPAVWKDSECGVRYADAGTRRRGDAEIQVILSPHPPVPPSPRPSLLTRFEIIELLAPYLEGKAVVCNLGFPSKELYSIKHQPSNFYMLGSMGMATPIGLGIALATEKDVVVIDGDGSLLMNPGTLATAASLAPDNLTIFAVDNGAYGSTGNQPTLAGSCVDLEAVARGFGIGNTLRVSGREDIASAVRESGRRFTFIHALAKAGNKAVPNIPLDRLEIKSQVQSFLMKS
jgi:sulfopyruvate decarboxylase subunit beta